jgi:hypothetical protein
MNIFYQIDPSQLTRLDWGLIILTGIVVLYGLISIFRTSYLKQKWFEALEDIDIWKSEYHSMEHSRDYWKKLSNQKDLKIQEANNKLIGKADEIHKLRIEIASLEQKSPKSIAPEMKIEHHGNAKGDKERFQSHQKTNSRQGSQRPSNKTQPKKDSK